MSTTLTVIGSGFSGLAAACYAAKKGYKTTVIEKNSQIGGRARIWQKNGFTFDMGPSWYWMPEVLDNFFADFGYQAKDFYELKVLDPQYRVYFDYLDYLDLPAEYPKILKLFESIELNSSKKLEKIIKHGQFTYQKALAEYMQKPGNSWLEFTKPEFILGVLKGGIFKSFGKVVDAKFNDPRLRQILKFPVLFLGSTPSKIPLLYSLMLYTNFKQGTFYPQGGMHKIVEGMLNLAKKLGVQFIKNTEVTGYEISQNQVQGLWVVDTKSKNLNHQSETKLIRTEKVVASGDYHHLESLLPIKFRHYNKSYWQKRTLCPSSLLFYLGVKGEVKNLEHHNLFFDSDFDKHAAEIYENPQWPTNPLFYVSMPSLTDKTVAPSGCHNLFVLMPLAPGLEDLPKEREKYFELFLEKFTKLTGNQIRNRIIVKRSYCLSDFDQDYNSFKGNAYGLANTLWQTAIFKPKMRSKLSNLVFAGQLTSPGPGIPPCIFSGRMAVDLVS